MSNYKGYDLFTTVEAVGLRTRNQAAVLANIAEDNSTGQTLTLRATALILGYFGQIAPKDRGEVQRVFVQTMKERGFQIG